MQEEMSSALSCPGGAGSIGEASPPSCTPTPSTHAFILTHATLDSSLFFFFQNLPEGHPAEHTQVPGAAFLGLVEALQQGED